MSPLIDTMHSHTMTQTSVTVTNGNVNVNVSCMAPYDEDRIPLLVLYSAVLIVGLPANMITIFLTLLQVRCSNVLAVYLLSLSLSDFTYLLTLPLWAVYVNGGHYWPWSSLACKLTGYIFFTNMYISIFLLCCISLDRYVAVVYAVESRSIRQQRFALLVTVFIYVAVGVSHAPVFSMTEGNPTNGERRCFEPGHSTPTVTGFNYARFGMGFLGPLLLLVVTNRTILSNVYASVSLQACQKQKVCLLVVAVVMLFLVCFGPYHIILLWRAISYHFRQTQDACHFERLIYKPYSISLGLSTVSGAINPVLYVLSSNNIWKEIQSCVAGFRRQTRICQCCTDSSQNTTCSSRNSLDR